MVIGPQTSMMRGSAVSGVEPVGLAGHGADLVVHSLVAAVGHAAGDSGVGSFGMCADGRCGLVEGDEPGRGSGIAPLPDHVHHLGWVQIAGEDFSERLLELVGVPRVVLSPGASARGCLVVSR